MSKKILWYCLFVSAALAGFYYLVFRDYDFSKSNLQVINANLQDFSFVNQNGKTITQKDIEDKVYVVDYFFTTCKGICPKMNADMRRIFDVYKTEKNFIIISHTCMPEVDSVPLLKAYEQKMILGNLVKATDGSYKVISDSLNNNKVVENLNWNFVTGNKHDLYKLARESYMIDNNKPDSTQLIKDQFIHTNFFALVDKQHRLRAVYDGLKEDEINNLISDIKDLLKEKVSTKHFMSNFSNNPN